MVGLALGPYYAGKMSVLTGSLPTGIAALYLMPPLTALMSWVLFGERLAPLAVLGMAICVAGVALVNWRTGHA